MTKTLSYTAKTASGAELDFDFALHPMTASEDDVARLLTAVLAALDGPITDSGNISDGDVLQAVSMALAVRTRMVEETAGTVHQLASELVDTALAAPGRRRAVRH